MSLKKNNTIRVIMLVPSLPPLASGGAELHALKLGKALMGKGVSVLFISPAQGKIKGETILEGLPVYRLYSWTSRLFEWLARIKKRRAPHVTRIEFDDAREQLSEINRPVGWPSAVYYTIFYRNSLKFLQQRRNSFDIIHAHTMEWSAIVAVKLGKALHKKVLIKDSTMNGLKSLRRYPSGTTLQQRVIHYAQFVAMTAAIEKNLKGEGVPAEKITRIPNGITIPVETKQQLKQMAGQSVLFVGNLYQQPAKGIDILLKAWVIVTTKLPGAVLRVAGDGDIPAYTAFAKKLGIQFSVQFLGRQSKMEELYVAADVFVLPSRREGMSNALMEAMAMGIPCVATDISGNQDLIQHNINGILVPVGNVEALAESIGYLLLNPAIAAEMGRSARATIQEVADINEIADRYIELYSTL